VNNAGSSMWVNVINSISSVGITPTRNLNFLIKIDFDKTVKTFYHFNILPWFVVWTVPRLIL